MTITQVLKNEAEAMYATTAELIKLVDPKDLDWKPATGKNWMTFGQLILHCTNACGTGIKGFVTGDWGMPEGMSLEDMKPEEMMPPAEKMPSVANLDEALTLLEEDRKLALQCIDDAGEANLLTKTSSAPWGGPTVTLFQHIDHMIWHLGQHKGQLYYYLKLRGKDVNTGHLWGMTA